MCEVVSRLTIKFNEEELKKKRLTEDFYMTPMRLYFKEKGVEEVDENVFEKEGSGSWAILTKKITKNIVKNHDFVFLLSQCAIYTLHDSGYEETEDIIKEASEYYNIDLARS